MSSAIHVAQGEAPCLPSDSELRMLANAARLAPSADNTPAFLLERRRGGLCLFEQAPRSEPHARALSLLSCAAAVENLRIFARTLGYDVSPSWTFDARGASASLPFHRATPAHDLAPQIPRRHTNRRFFSGPALDTQKLSLLDRDAGTQTTFYVPTRRDEHRRVARLVGLAEAARFSEPTLLREIRESIRWGAGWSHSTPTGISPGSLEVEPLLRPMFRAVCSGPLGPLVGLGLHRLFGLRAGELPCLLSPHIAVLAAPQNTLAGVVDVGAAFQRVWLRLTQLGLSVQPMPAAALYALPSLHVPKGLRERLRAAWEEILPGLTPLMVLRFGHARMPSVRADRAPLEQFFKEAS